MSEPTGRALLGRHIDCPGVCDVWVERDAILAIEDEMNGLRARLRRIEEAARVVAFTGWYRDGESSITIRTVDINALRAALEEKE